MDCGKQGVQCSLRGRRSKRKGKGIRAQDRARERREEGEAKCDVVWKTKNEDCGKRGVWNVENVDCNVC